MPPAGREVERLDYLEFIARIVSHIPDKGQVIAIASNSSIVVKVFGERRYIIDFPRLDGPQLFLFDDLAVLHHEVDLTQGLDVLQGVGRAGDDIRGHAFGD